MALPFCENLMIKHQQTRLHAFEPRSAEVCLDKLWQRSSLNSECVYQNCRAARAEEMAAAFAGAMEGATQTDGKERLWQYFALDPAQWWDYRPRLRHKVGVVSRTGEEGGLPEAVEALGALVQQGCQIDDSLLYLVLKRCITEKDLVLGRRVHALAVQSGFESNAFLANHVIRMYASHGRLEEARQAFAKVAIPNAFMWATTIMAYARHEQPREAMKLYWEMRETSVKPDNHVFVAALQACATAGDLASGKEVHADIQKSACETDMFLNNGLVDMYAKCGSLVDARRVFDSLPSKNVVTWTALISGYAQHGLGQEALVLYGRMQRDDITPGTATFVCLLKACASVRNLHQGKQLHAQMQHRGLGANVVVSNCLVDMYAKCGSLDDARIVFDGMTTRNVVSWTVMMSGYTEYGQGQEALALFAVMQQEGMVSPDNVTFLCALKACASVGDLRQGKQLHTQTQEKGLEADVVVGSCLVDMYVKCGSIEYARQVFDGLPIRNVVTWTALIAGYSKQGLGKEALALYARMQQNGITPADHVTFSCLLQACTSVGAVHLGKQLHAQIQERGLEADTVIGSCLVDMYAKCGNLVEACRVFDRLTTRDVVAWTALLNGYAEHSDAVKAIQCFQEMLERGVQPNHTTFSCLLVACSHAGLVLEGQRYYRLMVEGYGIAPDVYHYTCMVDLLGRSGHLDEAETLLRTMPFKNDTTGWTSLLSACKSHNDMVRGQRCFDHLITLEPGNASAYVLLANIYANAGRWKDVDRIESLRKCAGAEKKPAKACIEVKNKVHEFAVGDDGSDLSSKLRSVNSTLRAEGGHAPQTELVLKRVSQLEKEDALCGHAEKLALAYGLMNTPNGTTLVVTKNLRMCNDCHSSTKIMSRVEKREIVVRDTHGVHRFLDGSCSCRDRH